MVNNSFIGMRDNAIKGIINFKVASNVIYPYALSCTYWWFWIFQAIESLLYHQHYSKVFLSCSSWEWITMSYPCCREDCSIPSNVLLWWICQATCSRRTVILVYPRDLSKDCPVWLSWTCPTTKYPRQAQVSSEIWPISKVWICRTTS